ncbi:DUF2851 family protein [Salegentibacter chungangensis]|uniref:DUF2851 family protein n=1 Tax=Salegentibacter chungangensis TaxID=1335724 RepID=A0ABW3NS07_9FLAO
MREEFLHHIWKLKKFDFIRAETTAGDPILFIDPGRHNLDSGPDFFNARLRIGDQLWAGNVEIHLKASDWYFHGHETDENYDNVILHVVWEDDVEIFRKDNTPVPSLVLKKLVDPSLLKNFQQLFTGNFTWINCEHHFGEFSDFDVHNWLERMYIERLEERSLLIEEMLKESENDWEAVLFRLLAKAFGLKVNGDAFLSMANSINFKTLLKCRNKAEDVEALFLGQSGLLDSENEDLYFNELKKRYAYLKHKFSLQNDYVIKPKYFRLRPDNFPNLRLAQLAGLYSGNSGMFQLLMHSGVIAEIRDVFDVEVTDYWKTHYNFGRPHKVRKKKLSKDFIDLLLINCIIPLRFAYGKYKGDFLEEELLELIAQISGEKNSVMEKFEVLRPGLARNALNTQALLQLKSTYCDKNRCLYCSLGHKFLQGSA